jgi:hypothetical protein
METLLVIGVLVGLWKANAEPPKVTVPPIEQRQVQSDHVTAEKPKPRKTSEWPLGY